MNNRICLPLGTLTEIALEFCRFYECFMSPQCCMEYTRDFGSLPAAAPTNRPRAHCIANIKRSLARMDLKFEMTAHEIATREVGREG